MTVWLAGTLSVSSYSVMSVFAAQTDDLPYFDEALSNVTVPVGREATFQCIVRNLKKGYQVNKILIFQSFLMTILFGSTRKAIHNEKLFDMIY